MTQTQHTVVSAGLQKDLGWLEECLKIRVKQFLNGSTAISKLPAPPDLKNNDGPYGAFIEKASIDNDERLLLILALAPRLQPGFLDDAFNRQLGKAGDFPWFGGLRGKNFRAMLPTGETAAFLLSGTDMEKRLHTLEKLKHGFRLIDKSIIQLQDPPSPEPHSNGLLIPDPEYADLLIHGRMSAPAFSASFPANRLSTLLEWNDLVLKPSVRKQVQELKNWVEHHQELLHEWGFSGRTAPGYKALFYGPSGTGKTLTASLLGKYTGKDVYRIDLSMVVSKFIGETEKNLATLFDKAGKRDWILFFDEADALFGKRTGIRDAHDKYANQEVSYLLQRIEIYPGLVILATNFKNNIDHAFLRRFQAVIHFPPPDAEERLSLWNKALPTKGKPEDRINFEKLANRFELTGAGIINVMQFASLQSIVRGDKIIRLSDIEAGIRKEYTKEGKMI